MSKSNIDKQKTWLESLDTNASQDILEASSKQDMQERQAERRKTTTSNILRDPEATNELLLKNRTAEEKASDREAFGEAKDNLYAGSKLTQAIVEEKDKDEQQAKWAAQQEGRFDKKIYKTDLITDVTRPASPVSIVNNRSRSNSLHEL